MQNVVVGDSQVVRVTLFEDRAEVERKIELPVNAGITTLRVGGISLWVDDTSFFASSPTHARILSSKVNRVTRTSSQLSEQEAAALDHEVELAEQQRMRLVHQIERINTKIFRVDTSLGLQLQGVTTNPRGQMASATVGETLGQTTIEYAELHKQKTKQEAELREFDEELTRLRARQEQGRVKTPRHETIGEIQLSSDTAMTHEIRLVYRVPCALWRPEHWIRLIKDDTGSRLEIRTVATAWQRTGEVWDSVLVRYSTARPSQSATPPLLVDDVLYSRRRADPNTIVVEAREQKLATTGVGHSAKSLDMMPGVDDGGEPLWYETKQPTTLESDGAPVRVDIDRVVVACKVEKVAYPEKSAVVHLKATAKLERNSPLLAGPTWIMRGTEVVGRGEISFVAAGDSFVVGCGVDDTLRVRRTVEEQKEYTPVIGTQKVNRTVKVFVSNTGDSRADLTVTERIPVSEIDGVAIALLSKESIRYEEKDGYVHSDLSIAPNGIKTLLVQYRVEANSNIVLPAG